VLGSTVLRFRFANRKARLLRLRLTVRLSVPKQDSGTKMHESGDPENREPENREPVNRRTGEPENPRTSEPEPENVENPENLRTRF